MVKEDPAARDVFASVTGVLNFGFDRHRILAREQLICMGYIRRCRLVRRGPLTGAPENPYGRILVRSDCDLHFIISLEINRTRHVSNTLGI